MTIKYRERTIEFDTKYRPNSILVDGVEMSMSRFSERHGWNWRTSASGNILFYESEDGNQISVPQKRFMEA